MDGLHALRGSGHVYRRPHAVPRRPRHRPLSEAMARPGLVASLIASLILLPADAAGATSCARTLTEAEFAQPVSERERAELVEALAAMVQRLYVDADRGRLI